MKQIAEFQRVEPLRASRVRSSGGSFLRTYLKKIVQRGIARSSISMLADMIGPSGEHGYNSVGNSGNDPSYTVKSSLALALAEQQPIVLSAGIARPRLLGVLHGFSTAQAPQPPISLIQTLIRGIRSEGRGRSKIPQHIPWSASRMFGDNSVCGKHHETGKRLAVIGRL